MMLTILFILPEYLLIFWLERLWDSNWQSVFCEATAGGIFTKEANISTPCLRRSTIHDLEHSTPQTAKEIATGRQLGVEIASQLIEQINGMGMHAQRASAGTTPQINDLVIRGYLISFNEGSAEKRFAIGFGSGASDLKVAVEGFQKTAQGLRKLGSGSTVAEGAKTPGADLGIVGLLATHNPAGLIISGGMHLYGEESGSSTVKGRAKQTAKEIADVLKKRFQEQGWID